MQQLQVDLRYRRAWRAALKCIMVRLALYFDNLDPANVISGHEKTARWLRDPVSSWYNSILQSLSSGVADLSFVPGTRGVDADVAFLILNFASNWRCSQQEWSPLECTCWYLIEILESREIWWFLRSGDTIVWALVWGWRAPCLVGGQREDNWHQRRVLAAGHTVYLKIPVAVQEWILNVGLESRLTRHTHLRGSSFLSRGKTASVQAFRFIMALISWQNASHQRFASGCRIASANEGGSLSGSNSPCLLNTCSAGGGWTTIWSWWDFIEHFLSWRRWQRFGRGFSWYRGRHKR